MSLGDALVEQAKKATREGEVEVSDGGISARADLLGSGPYGAEVRGISVQREEPGEGDRLQRTVESIVERVRYLSEGLEPLEVDPASGRGILRTKRSEVRGREYWELEVDGGDRVDVGRFRGSTSGGRERLPENFGHGTLRRLVDDLAEVLGDPPEQESVD